MTNYKEPLEIKALSHYFQVKPDVVKRIMREADSSPTGTSRKKISLTDQENLACMHACIAKPVRHKGDQYETHAFRLIPIREE